MGLHTLIFMTITHLTVLISKGGIYVTDVTHMRCMVQDQHLFCVTLSFTNIGLELGGDTQPS